MWNKNKIFQPTTTYTDKNQPSGAAIKSRYLYGYSFLLIISLLFFSGCTKSPFNPMPAALVGIVSSSQVEPPGNRNTDSLSQDAAGNTASHSQAGNSGSGDGNVFQTNPSDVAFATVSVAPTPAVDLTTDPTPSDGGGNNGGSTKTDTLPQPKILVTIDTAELTNNSRVTFPKTAVNQISLSKNIVIKNTGNKDLTVSTVGMVSNQNQFTSTVSSNRTITAGDSINFDAVFTPKGEGFMVGSILLTNNDFNNPEFVIFFQGEGTTTPKITVQKLATEVDRYQNWYIDFSHPMERESVCSDGAENDPNQFSLRSAGGTEITGKCYWAGYTRLIFDPYTTLQSYTDYTVRIPSAKSFSGVSLTSFTSNSFKTEVEYTMTHTVKSFTLGEKALTLDKTSIGAIDLVSTLSTCTNVTSLKLKKLDSTVETSIPCDSENSLKTINIADLTSALVDGGNSFYYEIKTAKKTYYRSFSFSYGKTSPDKDQIVNKVATAFLDTSNSVSVVNTLIKEYAKEKFTLKKKSLKDILYNTKIANGSSGSTTITVDDPSNILLGMLAATDAATLYTVTAISGNTVTISPALQTSWTDKKVQFWSATRPATDREGKPCLDWLKKDKTNASYPEVELTVPFQVGHLYKIGPFCNIQVSGDIFTSPLYPAVKYVAIADVYITDVDLPKVANPGAVDNLEISIEPQNGNIRILIDGKKVSGKMAMVAKIPAKQTKTVSASTSSTITVNNTNDLYVGMIVKATNIPEATYISAINENVVTLDKNTTGAVNGNAVFEGIEFFEYLVGDTFVFSDPNRTPDPSGSIRDGNALSFAMNEDPPNLTKRTVIAETNISVPAYTYNPSDLSSYGKVSLNIPSLSGMTTSPWSDNLTVDPLVGTGAVGAIISDVVNQKVPEVKPKIVQYVVKDITESVAPDIINILLGDVRKGITINMPSYLPDVFKKLQLKAEATVNTDFVSKAGGLLTSANVKIDGCIKTGTESNDPCNPNVTKPPAPYSGSNNAMDSYLISKDASTTIGNTEVQAASNKISGVVLALHTDAINQVVYKLWQAGALNLTLNKSFLTEIKAYRTSTRVIEILEILLKADSIIKVLAPGAMNLSAKDASGSTVVIEPEDDIEFQLLPLQPLILSSLPLSEGIDKTVTGDKGAGNITGKVPKMKVFFNDLVIDITGKKSNGTTYKLVKVRVSLVSKANFSLSEFSNPKNLATYKQTINGVTTNVPAVNLSICDDTLGTLQDCDGVGASTTNDPAKDLFYTIEVIEGNFMGSASNPLGLNPEGIYDVLKPTIQKLVLPVINFIVEEVPLPEMKSCGIQLYDMKVLPIDPANVVPYILVNTKLANYTFTGDCNL
jgi:hypothetical protein